MGFFQDSSLFFAWKKLFRQESIFHKCVLSLGGAFDSGRAQSDVLSTFLLFSSGCLSFDL